MSSHFIIHKILSLLQEIKIGSVEQLKLSEKLVIMDLYRAKGETRPMFEPIFRYFTLLCRLK